uniref:Uncharacterized protein n=1 Tax=Parascaris univalens TaxID=6257 RepID=A0A915C5G4_PARUN
QEITNPTEAAIISFIHICSTESRSKAPPVSESRGYLFTYFFMSLPHNSQHHIPLLHI